MSRLNPGTVLAGIFALLFAFTAAYVVRSFLVREPQAAPAAKAVVDTSMQVPSASSALLAGRTITLGDIAMRQMEIAVVRKKIEANELPADFMTNPEQIVGRILREPIKVGDSFSAALFYPEGTGPTVADKLKPGLRAVTISVTDTGLVSGFASPTTLVDVLFRSEELDNFPETTFTLIEGIEVLAVGRSSYPNSQDDASSVQDRGPNLVHATLAVTPEQASTLLVLEGRGEMSLSLRSPDERSAQAVESDLLAANGRLSIWAREENLLKQMEELSAKTGTEFKEQERLATIATEIEAVEIEIQSLEAEQARSQSSESRKLTLADVLGIPEPPAPVEGPQAPVPPKMELYLGGQRSSLIFEPTRDDPTTSAVASPVSAVTPVSTVAPASDNRAQTTRGSAAQDNTTSLVAPDSTKQGRQARIAKPINGSAPGRVPVSRTAATPAATASPAAHSPRPVSAAKSSAGPAADGRQSDVKLALQQIDQRVQAIQDNQERSLTQLSSRLAEELTARQVADVRLEADSDMTAKAKLQLTQQQEDLNRSLQQLDQRMLAMQANQEQSLAQLSTQLTSPALVSEVPVEVRREMRDSVSRIDKLTQLVETLENRLLENEKKSSAETVTTLQQPPTVSQESKDALASKPAATPSRIQAADRRGTSKSVNP